MRSPYKSLYEDGVGVSAPAIAMSDGGPQTSDSLNLNIPIMNKRMLKRGKWKGKDKQGITIVGIGKKEAYGPGIRDLTGGFTKIGGAFKDLAKSLIPGKGGLQPGAKGQYEIDLIDDLEIISRDGGKIFYENKLWNVSKVEENGVTLKDDKGGTKKLQYTKITLTKGLNDAEVRRAKIQIDKKNTDIEYYTIVDRPEGEAKDYKHIFVTNGPNHKIDMPREVGKEADLSKITDIYEALKLLKQNQELDDYEIHYENNKYQITDVKKNWVEVHTKRGNKNGPTLSITYPKLKMKNLVKKDQQNPAQEEPVGEEPLPEDNAEAFQFLNDLKTQGILTKGYFIIQEKAYRVVSFGKDTITLISMSDGTKQQYPFSFLVGAMWVPPQEKETQGNATPVNGEETQTPGNNPQLPNTQKAIGSV